MDKCFTDAKAKGCTIGSTNTEVEFLKYQSSLYDMYPMTFRFRPNQKKPPSYAISNVLFTMAPRFRSPSTVIEQYTDPSENQETAWENSVYNKEENRLTLAGNIQVTSSERREGLRCNTSDKGSCSTMKFNHYYAKSNDKLFGGLYTVDGEEWLVVEATIQSFPFKPSDTQMQYSFKVKPENMQLNWYNGAEKFAITKATQLRCTNDLGEFVMHVFPTVILDGEIADNQLVQCALTSQSEMLTTFTVPKFLRSCTFTYMVRWTPEKITNFYENKPLAELDNTTTELSPLALSLIIIAAVLLLCIVIWIFSKIQ